MPHMIKLTRYGEALVINADHFVLAKPHKAAGKDGGSTVHCVGVDYHEVRETPDEILALIEGENTSIEVIPPARVVQAFIHLCQANGAAKDVRDYMQPIAGDKSPAMLTGARRVLGYLGIEVLLEEGAR